MFESMSPALDQFISGIIDPQLTKQTNWTDVVRLRDEAKGITGKTYSRNDPQVQLRMLTENIPNQVKHGWYPFDGILGPVQKSYASELREARDKWAHNQPFSDDDAYRILDTAERLLRALNAADTAEDIAKIRLNLRRVTADKDDKRTLKSAVSPIDSAGLQPWRQVLPPHEDVATGNFQAAEFAADLFKVSHGAEASKDYAEPVEFFARTYLTSGLRSLIAGAVRRLTGDDNSAPVVNLQTNFGGGKTHSMLSLWHLAAGVPVGQLPQDVQELLADAGYGNVPQPVHRVALVGNHISPSGSAKPDGTQVNTLWGELAWQLGGPEAFGLVAQADADRTPPGEALHTLLAKYSPAVILIDEWVAYARSLLGRDDLAGGTFDDQFTFAQSLTEAAKGTSGVVLAISIPASESGDDSQPTAGNAEEVGGANGLEALKRLQNVVRRVADQWRPASSDEAYHIVRQRLFQTPDAKALAAISATAKSFVELYRRHSDEFPREAHENSYEDRIKRTYPIHPEVFDRLYEDWSSLERFQRTRGVLRLMNSVIHALWVGEDASPLIMPGSIPIAAATVNAELTQYLQDSWKAVIDADVDGPNSEPARIDQSKPLFGQRSVTKRLARTVFFGAAPTIGTAHKGLQTQRVFLGTAIPGDVPGNFHSSLNQLADRATYFYSGSGKYWYDLQANITRRAKDQAERLHREEVWAEIIKRLGSQAKTAGGFAAVHVCPEDSGDIPDTDTARLILLHPRFAHNRKSGDNSDADVFAKNATEHRATAHRTNRNMVVFLAADEDRMAELDSAVRDYLGWSDVVAKQDELDLTQNQKNQALDKRRQADETVNARLLGTYQWALVPDGQPIEIKPTKIDGQSPALAERVSKRLGNDGTLSTEQAAAAIRHQLNTSAKPLWERGHLEVGDLWQLYASYAYMPRLRDRDVLIEGLRNQPLLWQQDGFAIADGYDDTSGRYRHLVLPTDGPITSPITNSSLIVRPDVATAQRQSEQPAPVPDVDENGQADTGRPTDGSSTSTPIADGTPRKTRFFGTKELSPTSYAKDFKNITEEVLTHLAATPGANLKVRIEIEAVSDDGFGETRIRTISENARTLKFDQSGFEDE